MLSSFDFFFIIRDRPFVFLVGRGAVFKGFSFKVIFFKFIFYFWAYSPAPLK